MIRRAAASTPVRATREAAWAMLTDLEQSARWLPGVTAARVLTREGDVAVAELATAAGTMVYEVVGSPPEEARFSQVDAADGGGLSGCCRLRETSPASLELHVEIAVRTPLLAVGSGRRLQSALESILAGVATRLERPSTEQLVTYRRALAVVRRGDVIEARVGDEVVELMRIGGDE